MIPLSLAKEPPILTANREKWGEEYKAVQLSGVKPPERYRRDDVKDALRGETHGKCAYCESNIEHISFAHIEHLIPKSVMPELVCAWENLTLACEMCNTFKGDYYSAEAPLLNPYTDSVSEDLVFYGPMAIDRSDRARLTISKLRLNRSALIFRRTEHLREILRILDLIAETTDNKAVQMALLEDLKERLGAAAEYTNCSRCFGLDEAPKRGVILPLLDEEE